MREGPDRGMRAYHHENTVYTVFIQIDAQALRDTHPSPQSSFWHTKRVNLMIFVRKNAWIYGELSSYLQLLCSLMMYLRSDFEAINTYQLHVLVTSVGLLFEWIKYVFHTNKYLHPINSQIHCLPLLNLSLASEYRYIDIEKKLFYNSWFFRQLKHAES